MHTQSVVYSCLEIEESGIFKVYSHFNKCELMYSITSQQQYCVGCQTTSSKIAKCCH